MNGRGLSSPTARTSFSGVGGEQRLRAEMREIATSGDRLEQKGAALLDPLHRLLRYDAAWIALRDSVTGRHVPLVEDGSTASLRAYASTDEADAEVQRLGLHRFGWPVPAHRLPVPLEETLGWGEYFLPAGFRDGLAVGLFTEDGRHLGYLTLLTSRLNEVTATAAALLHSVNSLIAAAVDPMATSDRCGPCPSSGVTTPSPVVSSDPTQVPCPMQR